jgi:hypothetical protein
LMAFMVKNPGLIPNIDTIKGGEIGRRRAQMYEMFQGMWRACINATDDETDHMNAKMSQYPEQTVWSWLTSMKWEIKHLSSLTRSLRIHLVSHLHTLQRSLGYHFI